MPDVKELYKCIDIEHKDNVPYRLKVRGIFNNEEYNVEAKEFERRCSVNTMNVKSYSLEIRMNDPYIDKMELRLKNARAFGILQSVRTGHGNSYVYFIDNKNGSYMLYIPDSVNTITSLARYQYVNEHIMSSKKLIVCGGKGLTSAENLFDSLNVETLDLSDFDTRNVRDFSFMFSLCEAKNIDTSNLNMSNCVHSNNMFSSCECNEINLPSFKIVNNANGDNHMMMFYNCKAKDIYLPSVSVNELFDGDTVFHRCTSVVHFKDKVIDFSSKR